MDRPGVRQVPEGSGEQGKKEKTGRKIICGAPTTLAVKGLMMIMMMYKNLSGNELTRNFSGNIRPQNIRSRLAEPPWTDPDIKSGISVRELISTSIKKYC